MELSHPRRTGIKLLSTLIAVAAVFAVIAFAFDYLMPDPCSNTLLSSTPSPDGHHKLVVFERSCGASTGFSTQASLIDADGDLDKEGGNALVADTDHGKAPSGPGGGPEVHVRWEGAGTVVLSVHPASQIFKSESRVDGVEIRLEKQP